MTFCASRLRLTGRCTGECRRNQARTQPAVTEVRSRLFKITRCSLPTAVLALQIAHLIGDKRRWPCLPRLSFRIGTHAPCQD